MSAHVLAGVGGHGGADALQRHREELGGLAACGLRGHDAAAQTVHRALQHDAADGGDAALQAHRDAHVAELEAVAGAQTALFPAPFQLRVVAADVDETADARHRLTEHGSEGRTERPHPEDEDAEQVEADVQRAGHQQEIEWPLAVAQRAHEGAGDVVQQGEGDATEDGADVDVRDVDDVVGGVGPDQHRPGQGHRHHREHDGEKEAQPDGIGGVAPHLSVVLRAEGPRDGDGEAAGDAVDEAQYQIVQAAHAAHRRQRIHAHEAAHDDGIGQIVELLEQTAQHQRHRKGKDELERAALCHVFCHTKPLPGRSLNISLPDLYRQKRPAGRGAGRFAFHEWYYTQLIVILQGVWGRFLRTTLLFSIGGFW